MASGGDDRRVLIWNVDKCIDKSIDTNLSTPMEGEHDSNVFCLDFDVATKRIFSGGNDERILIHDVTTSKFVNQYLQEEPVFGISCHPGRIVIYKKSAYISVQNYPLIEHTIVYMIRNWCFEQDH